LARETTPEKTVAPAIADDTTGSTFIEDATTMDRETLDCSDINGKLIRL